jgi:hypothetical protein
MYLQAMMVCALILVKNMPPLAGYPFRGGALMRKGGGRSHQFVIYIYGVFA